VQYWPVPSRRFTRLFKELALSVTRAQGWIIGVVGIAIAVVPLAFEMARSWGTGFTFQSGDSALIEIATRSAARFHQLVGPYDQFGWHHPGPVYFYLLSIPYHILGSGGRAEIVGQVGIAALSSLLVVVAVGRRLGRRGWLWAGACMAVVGHAVGFANFAYVWNPLAIIFPMVLVVVLGALAIDGSGLALLGVALVGSYCVQTEVSAAPLVAVVAVLGAAGALLARLRPDEADRLLPGAASHKRIGPTSSWGSAGRGWAVVGVAALIAIWVPPVLQEVSGPGPGNLGEILAFFTTSHPHASFGAAVHAVAAVDATVLLGPRTAYNPGLPTPVPYVWLTGAVVLGISAIWLGRRGRRPLASALGLLAVVGTAACVVAFSRIVGTVYGYLIGWSVAFPIAALLGVGIAALAPETAPPPETDKLATNGAASGRWASLAGVATAAVLVAGVALAAHQVDVVAQLAPESSLLSNVEVAQAWQLVAPHLRRTDHRVLVDIAGGGLNGYSVGAGLVDRMDSLGLRASVPEAWVYQFGRGAVTHGHEQLTVTVEAMSQSRHPSPGTVTLEDAGLRLAFSRPGSDPGRFRRTTRGAMGGPARL
jgi:hypothetical protein